MMMKSIIGRYGLVI